MRISTFFMVVALTAFTVSSCGIFGKSASTASTAAASSTVSTTGSLNGQKAGAALKSLYAQYKADGKLDMTNLTNLVNLATLAQNVEGLKGQTDKSAFYKDFAAGLILGSENLITEKASSKVTDALTSLANNVDLDGLKDKATTAVSNAAATGTEVVQNATDIANSVSNILNLFKK